MSVEQELRALSNQLGRQSEANKKALEILQKIIFEQLMNPDGMAVLIELHKMMLTVEWFHQEWLKHNKPVSGA